MTVDRRRWELVVGCSVITIAMLANILYVSTGRTALVVIVVLLVVFAIRKPNPKATAAICAGTILIGVVGWNTSSYLHGRATEIHTDLKKYEAADTVTSSGERLVYWKKSIEFISQAPLIGHGTGSIRSLFEKASVGQTGAAAEVTANPHHQTLAIAVQLGFVGGALLWAMWIAHLLLFRVHGLAEWIGFVIVVQNIVGSLFNSHLFDFVQGWVYVFGVGVAGGIALKNRADQVGGKIAKPAAA